MKFNILSSILTNSIFILSNVLGSDTLVTPNGVNIHKFAIAYCTGKNIGAFLRDEFLLRMSNVPNKNSSLVTFPKHITTVDLNSKYIDSTSAWYFTLGLCRSFIIMHEFTCILFDKILCEDLPDECKKLLVGNIKELNKKKCDIKSAQKLSVLTAINTSWEDTLSSMKEIVKDKEPLSYNYKLTEALFILHLKPSQYHTSNSVLSNLKRLFHKINEYKDEDVLFYAECITGALACVLKHDKKIPSNFEFDMIQTSDLSWRFMKNVKKLMQAYKDNFIKEQNKMNIINNNENIKGNNKNKTHNLLQDEEKIKLKQD